MARIIALLIAGLGLFFLGLHLVGDHLKQITGRRLRSLIARFTNSAWRGSLLGLFAGVLMQSSSAVVVILASMVTSGLVSARQALPIVTWSNVGATLIVFIGVFDIRIVILYCLGLSAMAFAFSGGVRWRPLCGVFLGVSLLFFGIHDMKSGAAGLQTVGWFQEVLDQARSFHLLALAAGALLAFLTQSTTAVAFLAVTLGHAGFFHLDQTMMFVYGGNVGSTFARMILASGLKGSGRQIGHFQDLFKIAGMALFVLLFYLEMYGGIPLVKAFVSLLSGQLETQAALVNLLCNLVPAVLVAPLLGPTQRFLDRCWPATDDEDFAKLKYLHPQALGDPETALDLVEKEQTRLLERLPEFAGALRPPGAADRLTNPRALHHAFLLLFREVDWYLTSLVRLHLSRATSDRLTNVHDRHEVIGFLEETVHEMVAAVGLSPPAPPLVPLVRNITEALHFLLTTLADAVTTLDPEEAELLSALFADRGEVLGKMRSLYLSSEQGISPQDRLLLLGLTSHFDRVVWLLRRFTELLRQNRQFQV
jgi:phosphate:Na+ symporter